MTKTHLTKGVAFKRGSAAAGLQLEDGVWLDALLDERLKVVGKENWRLAARLGVQQRQPHEGMHELSLPHPIRASRIGWH